MKIQITTRKPRNPFVAVARTRSAGSHRKPTAAMRALGKQTLRLELLLERIRST